MILSFKRGFFWLFLIPISLINVLLLITYSESQPVFAQNTKKSSLKSPQFMRELKLTDIQQKQIMTIKNKYENSIEQRREALKKAEEQLQQLMTNSTSIEAIYAKHHEWQRINKELENLRFNSMLEIRSVLTPAQRAQIAQIMNKHRQKFRQTTNHPSNF